LLHLVGYLYNCMRDARSQKRPICQSAIFWHYYELTLFSTLVRQGLMSVQLLSFYQQRAWRHHKCTFWSSCILFRFNRTRIFEKSSNVKFHENSSSAWRVFFTL